VEKGQLITDKFRHSLERFVQRVQVLGVDEHTFVGRGCQSLAILSNSVMELNADNDQIESGMFQGTESFVQSILAMLVRAIR